jgi:hypothetical protein
LFSDLAEKVSGQVFGIAGTELCIYSQPRPTRVLRRKEPWTAEAIGAEAMPFFRPAFFGPERTVDVFTWYPKSEAPPDKASDRG